MKDYLVFVVLRRYADNCETPKNLTKTAIPAATTILIAAVIQIWAKIRVMVPAILAQTLINIWLKQNCGKAATRALVGLLNQGEISCSGDQKAAYNRLLMFCTVNRINVNQWMVSKGWAFGG